jgi:hypothetical protein
MSERRVVHDPVARFFGGVMMAIGALIGGLAGLCTGAMVVTGLAGPHPEPGLALMGVLFGSVPIAIGIGAFFIGRMLWRRSSKRLADEPPQA